MKRYIFKNLIIGSTVLLSLAGCSDILEEKPHDFYEPGYFKTEQGVKQGLTSHYAHLRWIYGQAYFYNACQTGTDEATYAQSADGNFKDHDLSGVGIINPTSSRSDVLWNNSYYDINTASGIIENGAAVGVASSLIAESKFFRGFDYFLLVQTFGGVPLDLGAGELKFNSQPSRYSRRNTVPEVYTKAIFPDLVTAVKDLPDAPRLTGTVTKTVARLFLAKAYLTYAWWLENPNSIPTYPDAPRTDPDGHNAQWYFQKAYDLAVEGINNPGSYGLLDSYYDVNAGANDRNKEVMLFADHTQESEYYNGASLTYGSGGAPDNFSGWMVTWNYTAIRSKNGTAAVSSVQREANQFLGRPWTRMAPPIEVFTNTFADKTNDSRYDGTFTTVFRGNWNLQGTGLTGVATLANANGLTIKPGDAVLSFLNDEPSTAIIYPSGQGESGVGAGVLPGRADYVISPKGISRIVYPGFWKLGPYRTDNAGGLGQPNAGSTRPFPVAKFSELYLVAAEAAVKGATGSWSARSLVNVLRARAGKWKWDNNGNTAKIQDNSAAMTNATPAVIDINYILAERSREFFGEGYRWYDLVRTQKWNEIAGKYSIGGSNYGQHTPEIVTRTIDPHHYLRPIPQGQIDGMEMSADEKAVYQNPGY
ncbi:RagB/SusD family nutrient uptake outer membrane protein [Flavobacterium nitrogenifigens]|uniref:Starch-binding associating with outer membrane n=1 Tax=Flavobacterium nitrogenifigens TaxID=1617283 RepID=A0A521FHG4_9FLAO|nr:RagB/SusD family nutrient uptake outer membrane protein [Flavobacterium nitrogenifigens]KAF2339624.1 RagB/SusD family nutrient uptake outer membrane protein [Flavobacterium nitrogenifigens]SMO95585.1 Starch-binding associating with outer membrane [Flavobacterium nitrogenifigens]